MKRGFAALAIAAVLLPSVAKGDIAPESEGGDEFPPFILPPGQEALVEQLLAPYLGAEGGDRIVNATLKSVSVFADVRLADGSSALLDIHCAGAHVHGGLLLAGDATDAIHVVLAGRITNGPNPAIAPMARRIVENQRAMGAHLPWVPNPDTAEAHRPPQTAEPPEAPLPPESRRLWSLLALALAVALGGGMAWWTRRRSGTRLPPA